MCFDTRLRAASSNMPFGSPRLSFEISPPKGAGVSLVIPAIFSAALKVERMIGREAVKTSFRSTRRSRWPSFTSSSMLVGRDCSYAKTAAPPPAARSTTSEALRIADSESPNSVDSGANASLKACTSSRRQGPMPRARAPRTL